MNFTSGDVVIITDESKYSSLFKDEHGNKWIVVCVRDNTCALKNIKDIYKQTYISLSVYKEDLQIVGHEFSY